MHQLLARRIAPKTQRCLNVEGNSAGSRRGCLIDDCPASVRKESRNVLEVGCISVVNEDWQLRYRSIGQDHRFRLTGRAAAPGGLAKPLSGGGFRDRIEGTSRMRHAHLECR